MQKKLRQSYGELLAEVEGLRRQVNTIRVGMASQTRVLQAVVSLLGDDSVQGEMTRIASEQQAEEETQMAAGIAELKAAGVLCPVPETREGALVVGRDSYPDGRTTRSQFYVRADVLGPDMPRFLGKKPGDVVDSGEVKMEVVEVYELDAAKLAEYKAAKTKKPDEVPAAAAFAAPAAPAAEAPAEVDYSRCASCAHGGRDCPYTEGDPAISTCGSYEPRE